MTGLGLASRMFLITPALLRDGANTIISSSRDGNTIFSGDVTSRKPPIASFDCFLLFDCCVLDDNTFLSSSTQDPSSHCHNYLEK
jgi:hypothetical protein